MRTETPILIAAMRRLAEDIQSDDGVAQAAIFEGAQRIEELMDHTNRLERLLSIIVRGPCWEYKNNPEEYFVALKEAWRLLEERQP